MRVRQRESTIKEGKEVEGWKDGVGESHREKMQLEKKSV